PLRATEPADRRRWLLLIYELPPKPANVRLKVRRRLAQLGAPALQRSVHVLPSSDEARAAFQSVAREIMAEGGEAAVCEASFIEGPTDTQVESLFQHYTAPGTAALRWMWGPGSSA